MARAEFLKNLITSRAEWDALVATLQTHIGEAGESPRSEEDGRLLKNVIAHNIWYESEILRLVKTRDLSYEPADQLWAMRDNERNKVLYDMFRDLPLSKVLAEEQQVYKDLLAELRLLSDVDFNDPRRFNGMPVDWVPWRVIAENTYEHYSAHLDDLKKLLDAPHEA